MEHGHVSLAGSAFTSHLATLEKTQRDDFRKQLGERQRQLAALLKVDGNLDRNLIKQSKADAEKTLSRAIPIVTDFYTTHLQPRLSAEQVEGLWNQVGAVPGTFEAFARYTLSEVFGREFLLPLEASDDTFVLEVGSEDLAKLSDLIFGNPPLAHKQ